MILQKDNVMKSMIKNQQSFFVVQKIFNKLKSEDEKNIMKALIEKNLQYVNEKQIKAKCLALLKHDGNLSECDVQSVGSRGGY